MNKNDAILVNERVNDLRYKANVISAKEGISYDKSFQKAENLEGVSNVLDIASVNYGTPTFEYQEFVKENGVSINGTDASTLKPEVLDALTTASMMGVPVDTYSTSMSVSDIKNNAIEYKVKESKEKTNDKVYKLEKNEDVNVA